MLPMNEEAGQAGLLASEAPANSAVEIDWMAASGQEEMPAILATRPGGSLVVMPVSSCSSSLRERRKRKVEKAPATGFRVPALNFGAKGRVETLPGHGVPLGPSVTW